MIIKINTPVGHSPARVTVLCAYGRGGRCEHAHMKSTHTYAQANGVKPYTQPSTHAHTGIHAHAHAQYIQAHANMHIYAFTF